MAERRITANKVVHITYFIADEFGNQIERSDLPIGYVHGGRSPLLPRLEQALEGHSESDSIEVTISPEDGFGPHLPELTYTDDIENVPPQFRHIGAQVEMQSDRGEVKQFVVTRMEKGRLTVDGNHPLAGKTLHFTVKVKTIRDATPEEAASGQVVDGQQFGQLF